MRLELDVNDSDDDDDLLEQYHEDSSQRGNESDEMSPNQGSTKIFIDVQSAQGSPRAPRNSSMQLQYAYLQQNNS